MEPIFILFGRCYPAIVDLLFDGLSSEASADLFEQPVTNGQGRVAGEIAGVAVGQVGFQSGTFRTGIVAAPVVGNAEPASSPLSPAGSHLVVYISIRLSG